MLIRRKDANINTIICLEQIKDYLYEIKESYDNLHKHFLKYCIFPFEIYNKIIQKYNDINNKLYNEDDIYIKNDLEYLSDKIFEFSEKIKESSYENDIFIRIKDTNNKLIDYKEEIDKDIINSSNQGDITPPINIYEDEKKSKIMTNFSFIKEVSLINKSNEDYQNKLSLSCNICSGKAYYLCNNHCYNYFCDSCKNKFDEDFYSHNFEKINEKKEKTRIDFMNSFLYIIKNCCEIADIIFTSNNENIDYPILKYFDDIDSQKEFLLNIYNYKNISKNEGKSEICPLIKNSIINALNIITSPIEIIENSFSFSEDISSMNEAQENNSSNVFKVVKNHFLLIGVTGPGKSSFLNCLIGINNFFHDGEKIRKEKRYYKENKYSINEKIFVIQKKTIIKINKREILKKKNAFQFKKFNYIISNKIKNTKNNLFT